jgi:beta-phosphoglucomutase-like phosphatase (HAD superfamily)
MLAATILPACVANDPGMERPGLVIFDCDGVLVDTEPVVQRVLAAFISAQGWPMTVEESTRSLKGTHIVQIQREAERRLGRELPGFVEGYRAAMFEAFAAGVPEIPGAGAVLDALDAAGVPYCVGSNGPHVKMEVTLRSAGLMERLGGEAPGGGSRIFSADDVGEPKPSPLLFLLAAERMGFDPASCVVVDDSTQGVLGAVNAGMRIIGYEDLTPAAELIKAGAERVMTRLEELPGLLGLPALCE